MQRGRNEPDPEDRADAKRSHDELEADLQERGDPKDPRSRYGNPADWNFPRNYGGL